MDDAITDQILLEAIRKRLLDEIQAGEAAQIINNVYGHGGGQQAPVGGTGITDQLGKGDFDYFVDINRRDTFDPNDPERKIGWDKTVHRYRKKKGQGQ